MTASAPSPAVMSSTDPRAGREALIHFASAFVFLIMGLAALIWNSEVLNQGDFSRARVVGGFHWLTLGWLSISIFGAMRVFSGVALGSHGNKFKLTSWILLFWGVGALVFPVGLILSRPWFIIPGVLMIGIGLLLYTFHIVPTLLLASRGGVTRGYLTLALISLWCTWLLGGIAALIRAGEPVGSGLPQGYLQAHLLMAVFGWVGATVAGVGSHLIPMFALSRNPNQWAVKFAFPFWCFLQVFAILGAYRPDPFLKMAWIMASIVSGLWIIQVIIYFRSRLRKELEPGLLLVGGATVLLGLAWAMRVFVDVPMAFVGLLVVGWLTLFTLGIYHRVVPFLAWYVRFAFKVDKGPVPKVKDLVNERLGYVTATMSLIGALFWSVGLHSGTKMITYAGSLLIFGGSVFAFGQIHSLIYGGRSKQASMARSLWTTHQESLQKGEPAP